MTVSAQTHACTMSSTQGTSLPVMHKHSKSRTYLHLSLNMHLAALSALPNPLARSSAHICTHAYPRLPSLACTSHPHNTHTPLPSLSPFLFQAKLQACPIHPPITSTQGASCPSQPMYAASKRPRISPNSYSGQETPAAIISSMHADNVGVIKS